MAEQDQNFSIPELIVALLRDRKIQTGWWGLTMHFSAKGTSVAPKDATGTRLPGLTVAVEGVTLVPAKDGEEGSVNAAVVNPAKASRARKAVPSKALH
jgi:hypothetical protein